VHQPRDEALQQLALAEHDLGLVAHACGQRAGSIGGARSEHEPREEEGAAREGAAEEGDDERQADGAGCYPRPFRSSALIAGTTSCRSPITA